MSDVPEWARDRQGQMRLRYRLSNLVLMPVLFVWEYGLQIARFLTEWPFGEWEW